MAGCIQMQHVAEKCLCLMLEALSTCVLKFITSDSFTILPFTRNLFANFVCRAFDFFPLQLPVPSLLTPFLCPAFSFFRIITLLLSTFICPSYLLLSLPSRLFNDDANNSNDIFASYINLGSANLNSNSSI